MAQADKGEQTGGDAGVTLYVGALGLIGLQHQFRLIIYPVIVGQNVVVIFSIHIIFDLCMWSIAYYPCLKKYDV